MGSFKGPSASSGSSSIQGALFGDIFDVAREISYGPLLYLPSFKGSQVRAPVLEVACISDVTG